MVNRLTPGCRCCQIFDYDFENPNVNLNRLQREDGTPITADDIETDEFDNRYLDATGGLKVLVPFPSHGFKVTILGYDPASDEPGYEVTIGPDFTYTAHLTESEVWVNTDGELVAPDDPDAARQVEYFPIDIGIEWNGTAVSAQEKIVHTSYNTFSVRRDRLDIGAVRWTQDEALIRSDVDMPWLNSVYDAVELYPAGITFEEPIDCSGQFFRIAPSVGPMRLRRITATKIVDETPGEDPEVDDPVPINTTCPEGPTFLHDYRLDGTETGGTMMEQGARHDDLIPLFTFSWSLQYITRQRDYTFNGVWATAFAGGGCSQFQSNVTRRVAIQLRRVVVTDFQTLTDNLEDSLAGLDEFALCREAGRSLLIRATRYTPDFTSASSPNTLRFDQIQSWSTNPADAADLDAYAPATLRIYGEKFSAGWVPPDCGHPKEVTNHDSSSAAWVVGTTNVGTAEYTTTIYAVPFTRTGSVADPFTDDEITVEEDLGVYEPAIGFTSELDSLVETTPSAPPGSTDWPKNADGSYAVSTPVEFREYQWVNVEAVVEERQVLVEAVLKKLIPIGP